MTKPETKQKSGTKKPKLTEEIINVLIDQKLEQTKSNLSEEELEMEKKALKQVFINGMSPRHAMGLTPDFMNMVYNFGYNSYNAGQYEEAEQMFEFLNFVEPGSPVYLLALAASHQKLKDFEKAIELYFSLAIIDNETPLPYYHIADCYEQLNHPEGVLLGLNGAISRCGDDQKYAKLKGKCYAMLSKWKKELGIEEPKTDITEPEEGIFGKLYEEEKEIK